MLEKSKIQIQKLENGVEVPTFDGIYLCSRRNPLKEAEAWVLANKKALDSNDPVIILGLGAGFHLQILKNRPNTYVLELRSELASAWNQYNWHYPVQFVTAEPFPAAITLDFRPAWAGLEKEYEALSRKLRGVSKAALQEEAEKKDLWVLAEALKSAQFPEQLDLSVKDIAELFPLENQTPEARIWRTLRELVA